MLAPFVLVSGTRLYRDTEGFKTELEVARSQGDRIEIVHVNNIHGDDEVGYECGSCGCPLGSRNPDFCHWVVADRSCSDCRD